MFGVMRVTCLSMVVVCFFFQAEDGIRDIGVTGVQTCALPISGREGCVPRALYCTKRRAAMESQWGPRFGPPSPHRGEGRWRSEERRVGKECRWRWEADQKKKTDTVTREREWKEST